MNSTVARRRLSTLAVLSLLAVTCGRGPNAPVTGKQARVSTPPDGSIAITNVTIIDVASGAQETAVTVVTKAGQIGDIGRAISVPPGAVQVDGTGKFLIPGLWDMHTHHQMTGPESHEF